MCAAVAGLLGMPRYFRVILYPQNKSGTFSKCYFGEYNFHSSMLNLCIATKNTISNWSLNYKSGVTM